MSRIFIAGLCCLAMVQSGLSETEKSRDPIVEFLRLDPSVEHELVEIRMTDRLQKRDERDSSVKHIKIRALNDDIDLWLYPTDSTLATRRTPVYYSAYDPQMPARVRVELQPGLMRNIGQIFEDPQNLASFVIGKDQDGRETLNGRIGSMNLGVRSVPREVVNELVETRRVANASDGLPPYHVVYRIRRESEEGSWLTEKDKASLRRERPLGVPYVIYPKLLLVVDYSLFRSQESNVHAYLEYLVAFVNGIDLKYRALETPSFRFHIAGILIAVEDRGLPWISDWIVGENNFNSLPAMTAAKRFFYLLQDTISPEAYDLTLTLTKRMFGIGEEGVVGKSWVGVTCRNTRVIESMEAVVVAQDDNSFDGVHTAAHELGHAFGLQHDPTTVDDCHYRNGFIMSFVVGFTSNSSTFSSCSLEGFQRQIENRKYTCMYNRPVDYDHSLPRLLPGRVRSLRDQCWYRFGQRACRTTEPDLCGGIYCQDGYGNCDRSNTPALEGTPCGDPNDIFPQHCVAQRCVRT